MTVENIRAYLAAKAAGLLLLLMALSAHGGSAYVACNVPGGVSTLRLLVGTAPGIWTKTNVFQVPPSASAQVVTNLVTNLVAGVDFIAAQSVTSNGVYSDLSTNISIFVPAAPDSIQTVPLSYIIEDGIPLQVARDAIGPWRERMTIAATGTFGEHGLPQYLVKSRIVPDQPILFFRQQPDAISPPIP